MSKKKQNLADKILEYIRRNEREQAIPPGFKSIQEWCAILGCSRRRWGILLYNLLRTTKVKSVKLRRVHNGKICMFNFYKIDDDLLRQIKGK